MKITLSKSQWEMIGSKAGWMKKASEDKKAKCPKCQADQGKKCPKCQNKTTPLNTLKKTPGYKGSEGEVEASK